jgi:hypothetical protein
MVSRANALDGMSARAAKAARWRGSLARGLLECPPQVREQFGAAIESLGGRLLRRGHRSTSKPAAIEMTL